MENKKKINSIVMVGFFTAVTFLGIQIFRIPMPAAVGTPFLHFGHVFVVLGVLLLDGKRGAVSGTLGLVIFDLLNGYAHAIPEVFLGTIVKCLIIGIIMDCFKQKASGNKHREYVGAVVCAVIYGVMNVIIELISGTINMLIVGSGFQAALVGSVTSIPATVINAGFMIVAIVFCYLPIRSIYRKASPATM